MTRFVLILLIFMSISLSAKNKSSVYDALVKKYGSVVTLSMAFSKIGASDINGEIIATNDNKYRITIPGRIITSDGESIWNYSYDDDNVIVSNFNSHSENASPERLFFGVLENYKPTNLVSESSTIDRKLYKLTLVPDKVEVADIAEIILWLDDNNQIIRVQIDSLYGKEIWKINKLKTGIKLKDSEFKFRPPNDTEVIDLR